MANAMTAKMSSLSGAGRRNYSIAYISTTAYRMHLGPSPLDSAPHYEIILGSFHFWVNFPLSQVGFDWVLQGW